MSVSRKYTKSSTNPDLLIVTYSDGHGWTLCKASDKSQHLSPLEAIPHDHEKRKALMVEASKVAHCSFEMSEFDRSLCRPERIELIHSTLISLHGAELKAAYKQIAGQLSGVEVLYVEDFYPTLKP